MINAAKEAGFEHVELGYEPVCAIGCFGHIVEYRIQGVLQQGDVIHVADVGGGTGDFVSVEVDMTSNDGAKLALKMAGKPKGAPSQFLSHLSS